MKGVLLVVCLLYFGTIAFSKNGAHDFLVGKRTQFDKIVYQARVQKSNWVPFTKVTKEVKYPNDTSSTPNWITAIYAFDLYPGDTGGFAKLVEGGPGTYKATLLFTSQRSRGFDFNLYIYGQ